MKLKLRSKSGLGPKKLHELQQRCRAILGLELLEDRNLLAVTSAVAGGLLTVTGDGANDNIVVRLMAGNANKIEVLSGGTVASTFDRGVVQKLLVNGGAGNDSITIDESRGTFTTTIATTLQGGAGNDTLQGGSGPVTLVGGLGTDTFVTPSLANLTAANLRTALGAVQSSLNAKVLNRPVPLIGSSLVQVDSTGKLNPTGQIIADLQTSLVNAVTTNTGDIPDALFNELGPNGRNLLGDTDGSGTIDVNDVRVISNPPQGGVVFDLLLLRKDSTVLSGRYDFGLAMQNMPISLDNPVGKVDVKVGYSLPLQFGVNGSGAAIVVTPASKPLAIDVTATAARITNEPGSAGIFRSKIADNTTNPSNFTGTYTVSVANSSVSSGTLTGLANVHFNLRNNFGDGSPFDLAVVSDFDLTRSYAGANPADTTTDFGGSPTMTFKNVKLDMGAFFTKFVAPIFAKIQTVTKPLQPIIDFFNYTIPVLSEIMGAPVTVATLVAKQGSGGDSLVKFLKIAGIINSFDVSSSIPNLGTGNAFLPLGDFLIGGGDTSKPSILPAALSISVGTAELTKEAEKEVEKKK